jgi:hypothetical protein
VQLQAKDDDQDGHVLQTEGVEGTDCNDQRADVRQGAAEQCSEAVDFDCDGMKGCADSDCQGKTCDDNNACTLNEQCGPDAQCVPASTVRCDTPPNAACYQAQGSCNPSSGQCEYTARPASTPCDDNNLCTQGDTCGPSAQCAGTAVQCNSPPNTACYEAAGQCNAASGQCSYTPRAASASCNDGDACTTNDRCNGSGSCAGTTLPPCTARACYRPVQACAPSGSCMEVPDPTKTGTACIVGGVNGRCRSTGACTSFPFDPSNFNPDSIPPNEVSNEFRVSCGGDADPVRFNSETLAWTLPASCTLNTPTAKVITSGGVEVAMVPMRGLIIEAGRVLRLEGTRPVILAVYGDATFYGDLFANGRLEVPGAGGNRAGCGTQRGGNGNFSATEGTGGGGGAFGGAGASGGRNRPGDAVGTAGTAQTSTLQPLVGGCPGGTGGRSMTTGGVGGAGGGAVQVAVSGTLRVEKAISVSGGGGRGGGDNGNEGGGGGGGGSGGGLLLEANRLELTATARLTANGGGGGEGGGESTPGQDGENGSRTSRAPAAGGTTGSGPAGGPGGAEAAAAGAGLPGANKEGGGGGGGGVGVIRAQAFGSCGVDPSCAMTDNTGCDISPRVAPVCPP